MNSKAPKQISVFSKMNLIGNIILFGVIGLIYLMEDMNLLALILFAIGLINFVWLLFTFPVRNILFAVLNFIYSAIAISIGLSFQLDDSPYIAMLWFTFGLIYLIIAFVILLKRKAKNDSPIITESDKETINLDNL